MGESVGNGVVLIVEDEALILAYAAEVIEDAGYHALTAANADAAIVVLEARDDIRVVFTDINMPGSMDGIKLAAAVRGRWPPIRIIVTSALAPVSGALPEDSVFIPKPYHAGQISKALQRMAA